MKPNFLQLLADIKRDKESISALTIKEAKQFFLTFHKPKSGKNLKTDVFIKNFCLYAREKANIDIDANDSGNSNIIWMLVDSSFNFSFDLPTLNDFFERYVNLKNKEINIPGLNFN